MTVGVVDFLEVIDIHHRHGERRAVALGLGHGVEQAHGDAAAVHDGGERVGDGDAAHLLGLMLGLQALLVLLRDRAQHQPVDRRGDDQRQNHGIDDSEKQGLVVYVPEEQQGLHDHEFNEEGDDHDGHHGPGHRQRLTPSFLQSTIPIDSCAPGLP